MKFRLCNLYTLYVLRSQKFLYILRCVEFRLVRLSGQTLTTSTPRVNGVSKGPVPNRTNNSIIVEAPYADSGSAKSMLTELENRDSGALVIPNTIVPNLVTTKTLDPITADNKFSFKTSSPPVSPLTINNKTELVSTKETNTSKLLSSTSGKEAHNICINVSSSSLNNNRFASHEYSEDEEEESVTMLILIWIFYFLR